MGGAVGCCGIRHDLALIPFLQGFPHRLPGHILHAHPPGSADPLRRGPAYVGMGAAAILAGSGVEGPAPRTSGAARALQHHGRARGGEQFLWRHGAGHLLPDCGVVALAGGTGPDGMGSGRRHGSAGRRTQRLLAHAVLSAHHARQYEARLVARPLVVGGAWRRRAGCILATLLETRRAARPERAWTVFSLGAIRDPGSECHRQSVVRFPRLRRAGPSDSRTRFRRSSWPPACCSPGSRAAAAGSAQ